MNVWEDCLRYARTEQHEEIIGLFASSSVNQGVGNVFLAAGCRRVLGEAEKVRKTLKH